MQKTEQIRIKKKDPFYPLLDSFCFASKNLYNQALYRVRQQFCGGKGYLDYNKLDASFKADNGLNNSDYRNMPSAAAAQQTLLLLHHIWVSFFELSKRFKAHPESFAEKHRLPKYLDKIRGRQVVFLPWQSLSLKRGYICFPKTFKGFKVKFRHDAAAIRQVRFIPSHSFITVEVVYLVEEPELLEDNGRYFGIDLGVSNFAAIASNVMSPLIINGAPLKAVNQRYNKSNTHYRAVETAIRPVAARTGGTYCKQTNRLLSLTTKRNTRIKDMLHKISRYIVDLASEHEITRIVIGKNNDLKQNASFGGKTNKGFIQLPYAKFISMLIYKARLAGIKVIATEESYTSKTSHIDAELPVKYEQYKGKRVKRGLFQASNGFFINADINAAAQTMRKVIPTAQAYGIAGGVNPVKVVVV